MPKRKRMSFTVKRKRLSSTPSQSPQPATRSATQPAKRPRGRPPRSKAIREDAPAKKRREEVEAELGEEDGIEADGDENDNDGEAPETEDLTEVEDQPTDEPAPGPQPLTKKHKKDAQHATTTGDTPTADADSTAAISGIAHVSKNTIAKKWAPLSPGSQSRVRSLLSSASRPVIAAHLDPAAAESESGRGAEVQAAVDRAVRMLERRLPRMPFPPKTTGGMFDHDALLASKRTLERQVRAQTEQVGVLEGELKKIEKEVEEGEREVEGRDEDYRQEKERLEERYAGEYGGLLKISQDEPPDSARRIKLAPWTKNGNKNGEIGEDGGREEGRRMARTLKGHLDASRSGEVDERELEEEIARATDFIEKMLRERRQPAQAQALAAG